MHLYSFHTPNRQLKLTFLDIYVVPLIYEPNRRLLYSSDATLKNIEVGSTVVDTATERVNIPH